MQGLGFRVWRSGFRVWGLGFRVLGFEGVTVVELYRDHNGIILFALLPSPLGF